MGIQIEAFSPHWNYFLSIEDDVLELSRWIELVEKNYKTYSIELARLLMTSCSEVDVIAKLLCRDFFESPRAETIGAYQTVLCEQVPGIASAQIRVPRFGLVLSPFERWQEPDRPPLWWTANNKVKHHRSEHFDQATLKNTLNAVAGLFYLLVVYYGRLNQHIPSEPKIFRSNLIFPAAGQGGGMVLLPSQVTEPA